MPTLKEAPAKNGKKSAKAKAAAKDILAALARKKDREPTAEEIVEALVAEGHEVVPEEGGDDIEAGAKLLEFKQSFGGKKYRIRAEKFNKEEAEFEIIPQLFTLDEFDPIVSLKAYGQGKYRLTLLNEKGKYVEGGREYIRLAAPIQADVPESAAPEKKSALEDPAVALLLKQMESREAQSLELMKSMLARPSDAPKPATMAEMVDMLSKLKTLSPSEGGGLKQFKEMAELFTVMRDIMPDRGGESAGEGSWLSDLLQAAKILKENGALERLRPAAPAPAPVANPRAAIVREPAPKPKEPETVTTNPIVEGIKKYIPIFVGWAQRGEPVDDAGIFLYNEVNAEIAPLIVKHYRPGGLTLTTEYVIQYLVNASQKPEEVERIYTYVPELAPYRDWVAQVVTKAVQEFTSPDPEASSEPAASEAQA